MNLSGGNSHIKTNIIIFYSARFHTEKNQHFVLDYLFTKMIVLTHFGWHA